MNKMLKKALLYGLLPMLILIFATVMGLTTVQQTKMEMSQFFNVAIRNENAAGTEIVAHVVADAFDDEREMAYMESSTFELGHQALSLGFTAPEKCGAIIVQLDEFEEEIEETPFEIEQGTGEKQIPLNPDATSFRLLVSNGETVFTHAKLLDHIGLNVRVMLFYAFGLLGLYALLVFYRPISKKPEYGFLIAAVCVTAIMFMWVPLSEGIVWDGAIHRGHTESIAYVGLSNSSTVNDLLVNTAFSDIGYVPGAIGMRIGLLFTDDFDVVFLFTRVANALTYIAACFFAVKSAIKNKMIFAIGALMPTALFLGNSCSYDLMVNGFLYLFFSLLLTQILTPEKKITASQAVALTASLILACAPKAVYVPIGLFMLCLPKSKFASKGQHFAFNATVLLLFIAIASTFVLPILLDTGSYGDARGGDVNAPAQVAFILGNPIGYMTYLLSNIYNHLWFWLQHMTADFAYGGLASQPIRLLLLLLLAITALTDVPLRTSDTPKLTLWRKAILFVCLAAAVAMICTSMFISFTEPGSSSIAGIQPRYFLSLIPVLFILLQPAFLRKKKECRLYPTALLTAAVTLNLVMIATVLIY